MKKKVNHNSDYKIKNTLRIIKFEHDKMINLEGSWEVSGVTKEIPRKKLEGLFVFGPFEEVLQEKKWRADGPFLYVLLYIPH